MTQRPPLAAHAEMVQAMQSLVLDLARALVDDTDAVTVEAIAENDSTLLRLRVSQKDVGKVIGKQGRTARSLRTILGAASMKLHHRFALDILEHGAEPGRKPESFADDSQNDL